MGEVWRIWGDWGIWIKMGRSNVAWEKYGGNVEGMEKYGEQWSMGEYGGVWRNTRGGGGGIEYGASIGEIWGVREKQSMDVDSM